MSANTLEKELTNLEKLEKLLDEMDKAEIVKACKKLLNRMDKAEIKIIRDVAWERQKYLNNMAGMIVASQLEVGSEVWWDSHKRGVKTEGTVTKINRTRAIVQTAVGGFQVPLSMLHIKE